MQIMSGSEFLMSAHERCIFFIFIFGVDSMSGFDIVGEQTGTSACLLFFSFVFIFLISCLLA